MKRLLPLLLLLVALPSWGTTYYAKQTATGTGSGTVDDVLLGAREDPPQWS